MGLYLWAPLLIVGWFAYFLSGFTNLMFLIFLIVGSIIVLIAVWRGTKKSAVANNIVAVAVTLDTLSPAEKRRVHEHAVEIFRRTGWSYEEEPIFMRYGTQRYAWYALSMAELGIKPSCLMESWNIITTPFIFKEDDSYLNAAVRIAERKGAIVDIPRDCIESD